MKWLEIIELRAVMTNREQLESQLQELMDEATKEVSLQNIKAYSHFTINSDVSIHLIHDSVNVDINGSLLGLQLASSLKEFGLVNHSIWIEMHNK